MFPFLFDLNIGGVHLRPPTYGILLAIAFSSAYFYSLRRAVKWGLDPKHIENLFLLIVFASIIGARLFHVLFEDFSYYLKNPLQVFAIWNGGYTLYGALLLSLLCGYVYTQKTKIPFLNYSDVAGPAIALGIGIGRLGCFFAGCCWGNQTDVPWAVTFSNPEAFTTVHDKPVHPTQLYESFACLILFAYLLWRSHARKYFGQVMFQFLIGYSLIRFGIEYFRGDEYRGYIFGGLMSYSQFVSLMIIPFVLVACFLYSRQPMEAVRAPIRGKHHKRKKGR